MRRKIFWLRRHTLTGSYRIYTSKQAALQEEEPLHYMCPEKFEAITGIRMDVCDPPVCVRILIERFPPKKKKE